jgi:hypothetical protein
MMFFAVVQKVSKDKVDVRNFEDIALFLVELYKRTNPCFPSGEDINDYFHLTIVPTHPSLNKNNKRNKNHHRLDVAFM